MDASRALALLSASPQITPLSLRLDAAALLSRIIEDHRYTIRFLDDDRALTEPLLAAVVRAMLELDAHDEELGDALVALLNALLRATSIATEQLFVQLDIMMGGSGGQSWALPSVSFALISLIELAFDVDLHTAAAALPKCPNLVRTLARGVDAVAETRAHPGRWYVHAPDLATCSLQIFVRLLQACDEPASMVLDACSLSPNQFIGLLPGVARESRPSPSITLLELLFEIAADARIAPLLATPVVLAALKPPLLSGYAPLQLACINVLAALHDNGGPASRDAIVAEGIMILDVIRQQGAGAGDRLCLKRICENAKVGKVSVEPPAYAAAASTATAASSADSAAHALPTGQPKQTTPATALSTALIVMPSTRGNSSSGAPGEAPQGAQYDQVDAHDDDHYDHVDAHDDAQDDAHDAAPAAPLDAQTPSRKRPFEPDPSASTPGGSPSKVDPPLFLTEGSGVTKEGDRPEAKRRRKELKALRLQQCKWATKTGAIIAPSRKKEGYVLPVGNQLSCLVDALYNGLCTLGFDSASLARLRKRAMPELGNDPMASWDSVIWALADLGYPYVLQESTSRFDGKGGLMLNLLRAPAGVYLVSLQVIIDGKESKHGVVLSKLAEEHAPHGKLIDNHGKMQPCYLESKDTNGKEAAKMAWKLFIGQNPATKERPFSVNPAQVFELKKKA